MVYIVIEFCYRKYDLCVTLTKNAPSLPAAPSWYYIGMLTANIL